MDEKNAFELALSDFGLRYWEYDIRTKRLYRSKLVQGEVGYAAYKENVPESYIAEGIIHPDYEQAYIDFYTNIQNGIDSHLAFQSLFGNGEWGWLDISYKVLFDEEGKPFKAIGIGGDITEKKNQDGKIHQIECMLESTAANEYDYITFMDGKNNQCIYYSSRENEKVLLHKTIEEYFSNVFKKDKCDDYEELIKEFSWSNILEGLKKDGEYIQYVTVYDNTNVRHRKKYSFYYINAEEQKILETCRDLTALFESTEEQKKALSDALTAATVASKAKSEFLSSMSHEIRTPMNAILGLSALGLDETKDENAQKYFCQIQTSGKFLLGLINDILDMSKIEQGKIELHEEYTNGVEFLHSVANLVRPIAEEKGIIFTVDFEEADTPWVKMDRMRSEQIYINLLNNAIKFSQSGSKVEWIVKDMKDDDNHMHMISIIRDHGCGMSSEFQKRLFLPFTQEQNKLSNINQVTGLGLAIVKNLVEQMGGTITCKSELDVGTTFTINLKRVVDYSHENIFEEVNKERKNKSFKGKRVLLCEDHPINAEIAIKLLQKQGIIVDHAENGQLGVERFKNSKNGYYQAILMDIRMPVKDGLQATKEIRGMNDRKDASTIPIIAMTANAFLEDKKASLAQGMNLHLAKPIIPEKLFNALDLVWKK